ncbi:dephospho-CoA kinase [Aneurinibacillus soli]|uniref:Dephospho-CoA kinase n=1 Tax=Aneurinibacillus soli TaxID=1500254 RepID=A0A0U5BGX0_9BACL|nr:dephospho-CoA kinase [Aneurinibacillus soli]PYE59091.1 dephospho-CoA kinase [Aneurinibacillus soli]BAU29511.1 Dephospho-CoA kinase [Aneurinibacillus soli]
MRIGLTGSIACGKSTVSRMLAERGARIVDADVIARDVVRPGEAAWSLIIDYFGQDILLPDRQIDRIKLGQIVFADEEARRVLNGIVHPAVRSRMRELAEEADREGIRLIVLDIPLLYESKLEYMVERVVVVSCTEEQQLARLIARNGFSEEDAQGRIASQMPIAEKVARAHDVIDNSGTLTETERQVNELVERLRTEDEQHR